LESLWRIDVERWAKDKKVVMYIDEIESVINQLTS